MSPQNTFIFLRYFKTIFVSNVCPEIEHMNFSNYESLKNTHFPKFTNKLPDFEMVWIYFIGMILLRLSRSRFYLVCDWFWISLTVLELIRIGLGGVRWGEVPDFNTIERGYWKLEFCPCWACRLIYLLGLGGVGWGGVGFRRQHVQKVPTDTNTGTRIQCLLQIRQTPFLETSVLFFLVFVNVVVGDLRGLIYSKIPN